MTPTKFQVVSDFQPRGDQPAAIDTLVHSINQGDPYQTLMGVTGSGKTFTMAHTIAQLGKPALVISHNKTLAAQLYEEFKDLFPHNAVCYFVSYYDYYQPEAYIPQRDIYIEKDAARNDDLDRLRLAATTNLVSRRDVIVVASVSCIFGLGSPDQYRKSVLSLTLNQAVDRQDLLATLTTLQYTRGDFEFQRGRFRVRGDIVEVFPAGEQFAYRIELFGDQIDKLQFIHPTTGHVLADQPHLFIYPAVHYVMPQEHLDRAVTAISEELETTTSQLRDQGKLLEAHRLTARTKYDLEMIQELGYCSGIENYSRHLEARPPGSKPYTLLDYFPDDDWLVFIDESHVTVPQLRAMYNGDQARKQVLVDHGFRLPSALDNRPLRFEEIQTLWPQTVFVSATPGPYELEQSHGVVIEQIIRPTGLVDPEIEIRPAVGQVDDLLKIAQQRAQDGERTLVTTLTKRLAEDLCAYLAQQGQRCRYLHSDIQTLDRVSILRELREGEFDVLVGVNLLREGLDLPEVSLVAIMDADKTGFLRSATSLIQQIGRSARHINATVILYAQTVTPAMAQAIDETSRRRQIQLAYNAKHNIKPQSIQKAIRQSLETEILAHQTVCQAIGLTPDDQADEQQLDRLELIETLQAQMLAAAKALEFEKAAALRDRVNQLKTDPTKAPHDQPDHTQPTDPKPGTPGTPGAPGSPHSRRKKKHTKKWTKPRR